MSTLYSFIKKYAIERYINSGVIATVDILISLTATIISIISLGCILENASIELDMAVRLVILSIIASTISVLTMRTHRIIIRHSTIGDIWKFAVASTISSVIMWVLIVFVLKYQINFLSLLLLINALLTFCFYICIRIAMVIIYDTIKLRFVASDRRYNTLIYGSSEKSAALKVRLDKSTHYNVVGFVQYDTTAAKLAGLSMYNLEGMSDEQIEKIFYNKAVSHIIFIIPHTCPSCNKWNLKFSF